MRPVADIVIMYFCDCSQPYIPPANGRFVLRLHLIAGGSNQIAASLPTAAEASCCLKSLLGPIVRRTAQDTPRRKLLCPVKLKVLLEVGL